MPVDELQQTSPARVETAPPANPGNASTGSTPQGRRRSLLVAVVVGSVIILGAVGFWLYSMRYESTDDAQVDGHLNGITARIDGDVKAVYVEENQSVQAGQLLVELDPRDYQVALEQAQAQLLKAQAEVRAENPNLPITQSTSTTSISTSQSAVANAEAALAAAERDEAAAQAHLQEVQANNEKAQADIARYKSLVDRQEVALSEYDRIVATAKALAASVESARSSAESSEKVVEQRRAQLDQARSERAMADVNAPNRIAISKATCGRCRQWWTARCSISAIARSFHPCRAS
jgi:membrane fusion protein (multidrug efflux system)